MRNVSPIQLLRMLFDQPYRDKVEVIEYDSIQLAEQGMGREIRKHHHYPFQQ